MLSSHQQKDTWEEWLASEVRANYFAELVGHYQRRQRNLMWGILVLSSGAFTTSLSDWLPQQYRWFRAILPLLAAGLSLWLLLARYERSAAECSDLFLEWSGLGREFKGLWENMYLDGASDTLTSLLDKRDKLSKRCTNFPNRRDRVLKWERYVVAQHQDRLPA